MNFKINHDKQHEKIFSVIDGYEAKLEYSLLNGNILDLHHTFVPSELRGKGVAAELVKFAFNYASENNYKIIPTCSYVRAFVERHKEYSKLLA